MQEVSSEITYQLPHAASKQFKSFFKEFDQSLDALGIRSYGVGITTLEEVFLKIGHGEEVEQEKFEQIQAQAKSNAAVIQTAPQSADQTGDDYSTRLDPLENYTISTHSEPVFTTHVYFILKKKFLMTVRDRRSLFVELIFPIFLIFSGLAAGSVAIFSDNKP